jgi:energy-converting hydrogenase Eha subunit H
VQSLRLEKCGIVSRASLIEEYLTYCDGQQTVIMSVTKLMAVPSGSYITHSSSLTTPGVTPSVMAAVGSFEVKETLALFNAYRRYYVIIHLQRIFTIL